MSATSLANALASFQYPVSDRMGCNLGGGPLDGGDVAFQYPVSDRMGCNSAPGSRGPGAIDLSVSCIGSNGL